MLKNTPRARRAVENVKIPLPIIASLGLGIILILALFGWIGFIMFLKLFIAILIVDIMISSLVFLYHYFDWDNLHPNEKKYFMEEYHD